MEEFKEKPFKDDWYFEKLKVFMKVYGIEMSKVFDTKEDKSNVFGFDKRSVFGRNNLNLLFGRKEFALNLEKIIKNIDKNENVIAIHSEFGTGKSYFANEFKKYFETEENPHKFFREYVILFFESFSRKTFRSFFSAFNIVEIFSDEIFTGFFLYFLYVSKT